MLTPEETELVKHLSNAGKGLITITEIISNRRVDMYECNLLTDVVKCVTQRLQDSNDKRMVD